MYNKLINYSYKFPSYTLPHENSRKRSNKLCTMHRVQVTAESSGKLRISRESARVCVKYSNVFACYMRQSHARRFVGVCVPTRLRDMAK
jgi:hypothetical protein